MLNYLLIDSLLYVILLSIVFIPFNKGNHSISNVDLVNPFTSYPDENLKIITGLSDLNHLSVPNGDFVKPLLVPRVVGSKSHQKVQEYLRTTFENLGWTITEDTFTVQTPLGLKTFNNIIATKFPNASHQLVLSAHYDSKYYPPPDEDKFIGATDSSIPCAIIIDIATSLNSILNHLESMDKSLQIIFFDGEEAFVQWSKTDSLYGSRHLAQVWENTFNAKSVSFIESIDMLILLDLLGTSDMILRPLQISTESTFLRIVEIERKMNQLGLLPTVNQQEKSYFIPYQLGELRHGGIEDDHLPFLERNVPVLHLISVPFPKVWHTFEDNADALDQNAIHHLTLVLRAFIVDYFGLAKLL